MIGIFALGRGMDRVDTLNVFLASLERFRPVDTEPLSSCRRKELQASTRVSQVPHLRILPALAPEAHKEASCQVPQLELEVREAQGDSTEVLEDPQASTDPKVDSLAP